MIYPPINIGTDRAGDYYSVMISLPPEVDAELESYAESDGDSWILQVHGALYQYRLSFMTRDEYIQEFKEMIEEGLNSGEGKIFTEELINEIMEGSIKRLEKIKTLEEKGLAGNLPLPVELYEFIKEKIATKEFSSPTEVVLASIPFLRKYREASS